MRSVTDPPLPDPPLPDPDLPPEPDLSGAPMMEQASSPDPLEDDIQPAPDPLFRSALQPKPARRRQRRRPMRPWLAPLLMTTGFGLAVLASGFVIGMTLRNGSAERMGHDLLDMVVDAGTRSGLAVGDLLVVGRLETSVKAILQAVGVKLGDPLLMFDPQEVRARLLALTWVKNASVQRRFPDTILVQLQERTPIGFWQNKKTLALVDEEGIVLSHNNNDLIRYNALPVFVGDEAPVHAEPILKMLEKTPDLATRVTALTRVAGRRWDVRLDDRIDVHLPEFDPEAAWARFAQMEENDRILARGISVVDLRLPDRMAIRLERTVNRADIPSDEPAGHPVERPS